MNVTDEEVPVPDRVGWVFDERYLWHDARTFNSWLPPEALFEPIPSPEHPATKRRFKNIVEVSGMIDHLTPIRPRPATRDELLWLHTAEYVDSIEARSNDQGGEAGDAAAFSTGGYEIARLAAGGCIKAVDAVLDGLVARAYALVRPPGHHAVADRGLGFCIFANTALAATQARRRGVEKIAIVDWDVHHGNGTESAFYADPHVLTISLHQEHIFPPGTGGVDDTGTGDGLGYNINIPLPAGSGRAVYEYAFERVVLPALRRFQPDLIIVACGFDAAWVDPTARMNLTPECFARLTRSLLELATELCGGRIVFNHEGGYSAEAVPYCGLAVLEQLTGHATGVPLNVLLDGQPEMIELHEHERASVERAATKLTISL